MNLAVVIIMFATYGYLPTPLMCALQPLGAGLWDGNCSLSVTAYGLS